MTCKVTNRSTQDMSQLEGLIGSFYPYAQKRLGFDKPVGVNLISDPDNAKDPLGKTAYYDPNKMQITLFVDKRHVKDMLRSFSHELVHHGQNCRGEFDGKMEVVKGYAQKDPHMRKMEAEAYLMGNGFLIRDWEDQKEKTPMNEAKIREAIKEAFKIALGETELTETPEVQEEEESIEEDAMPMKKDTEDVDDDGDTEEEVPAFLKKEESLKEGYDHPGEECEVAHSGETHEEYKTRMAMMNKSENPHSVDTPVNESFKDLKDKLLNEELMKRWCK